MHAPGGDLECLDQSQQRFLPARTTGIAVMVKSCLSTYRMQGSGNEWEEALLQDEPCRYQPIEKLFKILYIFSLSMIVRFRISASLLWCSLQCGFDAWSFHVWSSLILTRITYLHSAHTFNKRCLRSFTSWIGVSPMVGLLFHHAPHFMINRIQILAVPMP